jgi:hypothetical protein
VSPTPMARRWALAACAALGVALVACSSSSTPSTPTAAAPGCHTNAATVHLVLTDGQPIPLVRVVPGGCIAVSVPRSPFKGVVTEPPRVTPPGRLHLVSDSVLPNGTRRVYYTALRTGTVTITSTVGVLTSVSVPEWNGVVVIV